MLAKDLTLGYSPYGNYPGHIAPFDTIFPNKRDIREGLKGIDCMILWGGTDVNPSRYGEKPHPYTQRPDLARDEFEFKAMLYCKAHNIPMIGVCRGAQALCVFAGGKLIQDVEGHGRDHVVETHDDKLVWVTSTHHQMMYPFDVEHKLLAYAYPRLSDGYLNGNNEEMKEMDDKYEPEIVYFPSIRGLAIQGHPEYSSARQEFRDLCCEYVLNYLLQDAS